MPDALQPRHDTDGRRRRRGGLAALVLAGALTAALPATAQDRDPPPPPSGELMDEAAEKIVEAFRLILRAIPQYEMPEVLPNGDILIRRVPPEPQDRRERDTAPPERDST